MATPEQIRQKLIDLAKKRADVDKRIADARGKQSKKESEAATYRNRAAATSSASTAKSNLKSAESAISAAVAEGRKVADESRKAAALSSQEAALQKDLAAAIKSDTSRAARARAQEAAADRRRQDTERRQQQSHARAEARRHEQELLAERARTQALLAATETRLTTAMDAIRSPKSEQLRILYLTASARGDLRVDEEIRRVKNAVRAANHRDLVDIEHKPAATTEDLMDGLTQFRPHVVHFSGHGDEDALVFDSGRAVRGPGQPVTAGAFATAIKAVDDPPTLVVLNACKSADQIEGLLMAAPVAIGMSDNIRDGDAMAFAARFYSAVADGQSIEGAWRVARAAMELDGLRDADLPLLDSREGVDPALVRLVVPPADGAD